MKREKKMWSKEESKLIRLNQAIICDWTDSREWGQHATTVPSSFIDHLTQSVFPDLTKYSIEL